jgi:hypothetical protein
VDKVEQNSTSTFSSQHLYLVAFLVCAGHGITDTVRNSRRVSFEFSQTPELLTDVAGFMSGALIRSGDSVKRSCRQANAGNSSSIVGWDTRTLRWGAGTQSSWRRTENSVQNGPKR